MDSIILQVPIDKDIKVTAQRAAEKAGFSSLQDFIRFVLTQFLNNKFTISVVSREPDEELTANEIKVVTKRHKQAIKELKSGKLKSYTNADEFVRDLKGGN